MTTIRISTASLLLLSQEVTTEQTIMTTLTSEMDNDTTCTSLTGISRASYHSRALHTTMAVILGMLAAIGTVGNTGVVVVVVRIAQLQRMTYILVANLSAIGLLVSVVSIPTHLLHVLGEGEVFPWEWAAALCTAQALFNFALFLASMINSVAIAVCRFKAVMAKHNTRLQPEPRRNIWKVLCLLWLLPVLIAISATPFVGYNALIMNCLFKDVRDAFWYTMLGLSVPALASSLCMFILYTLILKKVRDSNLKIMGLQHRHHHRGDGQDNGENRTGTESYISDEKSQASTTGEGVTSIKIITPTMEKSCLPATNFAPPTPPNECAEQNKSKYAVGRFKVSTCCTGNPCCLAQSILVNSSFTRNAESTLLSHTIVQIQPRTRFTGSPVAVNVVDYSQPSTSFASPENHLMPMSSQESNKTVEISFTDNVGEFPAPSTCSVENPSDSNRKHDHPNAGTTSHSHHLSVAAGISRHTCEFKQLIPSISVGMVPKATYSTEAGPVQPTSPPSATPVPSQFLTVQHMSPMSASGIPGSISYNSMDSSLMTITDSHAEPKTHKSKKRFKKEVKLMFHLFLAFIMFCLLYLPFCFAHLVHMIHPISNDTWLVLHTLALSFASNTWLMYALLNKDFRTGVKALKVGRRGFSG